MDIFGGAKWISQSGDRVCFIEEVGENGACFADDKDKQKYPAPVFKKIFSVKKEVKKATLYVCALGYGVHFINGKRVTEEVLTTPWTKFDSTVLYNEYDVTKLLNQKENSFVSVLGNGFYNDTARKWANDSASWRHKPKMIMRLLIEYADGFAEDIKSGDDFFVAQSPILYNQARNGEIYDARLEREDLFLNSFGEGWKGAQICAAPGGKIEKNEGDLIKIIREIPLKKVSEDIFDAGENISGWIKFEAKGERGRRLIISYAERLDDTGNLYTRGVNGMNDDGYGHRDIYIFSGKEKEIWHPEFAYHGFRYVKIENAPADAVFCAQVVHSDLKVIGDFCCSDEVLNKIHKAARLSTLSNFVGIPTDCPQREQNGWTGDAQVSSDQALLNYDIARSYKRWILSFKDVQRPSGQLPGIVPTCSWGYNWGNGPAWDGALIIIPYNIWRYTGDFSLIEQMWDNMCLLLEFMDSMASENILSYGLSDWITPKSAKKFCPVEVTSTAYYYSLYKIMAKCAVILKKDKTAFESRAKEIKASFRKRFLKGIVIEGDCQTSIACGIYHGLYNKNEISAAAEYLAELIKKEGYHTDSGVMGNKAVFCALSDNGYADVAYKMVTNPSYPSYAHWINSGMTTLCEAWEMTGSLNHHMFSEVDRWLYKYVAGLNVEEGKITIKPMLMKLVKSVSAKHGDISVEYNEKEIRVSVPKGAEVHVCGKIYKVKKGETAISL